MKADVTIIPAAPRTYAVPKAVSSVVAQTLNTPSRVSTESSVTDVDLELAKKLALEGRITGEDAYTIYTGLTASASSEISYNLRGGDVGRDWAGKIIDGLRRDELRERDTILERLDYTPHEFYYFGLSDKSDPELLRAVGRIPVGDYTLDNADVLTASGEWTPLSDDADTRAVIDEAVGTGLPKTLLASSASAFLNGFQAVYLSYATPACFLDHIPLLASAVPEDIAEGTQFVYAIVDPTDTTAVISLIMIKPGPQAYVRAGGSWVLDEPTLDALLSATPPPLVELNGPAAEAVIQQVDASQSGQVDPNGEGIAEAGEALEEAPIEQGDATSTTGPTNRKKKSGPVGSDVKEKHPEPVEHGTMPPRGVTAAAMLARVRGSYEMGLALTAAAASRGQGEADLQSLERQVLVRETTMRAALSLKRQLTSHLRVLEDVIVPVVASGDTDTDDFDVRDRHKAAPLRRYWLHGVGATKILWGTPGDWTRCASLLAPYLGPRAKGYCAKLHKDATGMWTGDTKHLLLSGKLPGKLRAPAEHGISAPKGIE